MSIVLGFDFGMKYIGVAVGQSITQTASPLKTLKAEEGIPSWIQIEALIQNYRPAGLVIGLPLNMDGTEQWTTQAAKQFGETLQSKFQLPVYYTDERLTSVEAKSRILKKKGKSEQQYLEEVNAMAAVLLLEQWLKDQ